MNQRQILEHLKKNPEDKYLRELFPIFWDLELLEEKIRSGTMPQSLENLWVRHGIYKDVLTYRSLLKQSRVIPKVAGVIAGLILLLFMPVPVATAVGLGVYTLVKHVTARRLARETDLKRKIVKFLEGLNWLSLALSHELGIRDRDELLATCFGAEYDHERFKSAFFHIHEMYNMLAGIASKCTVGYDSCNTMTPHQAFVLGLKSAGAECAYMLWTVRLGKV